MFKYAARRFRAALRNFNLLSSSPSHPITSHISDLFTTFVSHRRHCCLHRQSQTTITTIAVVIATGNAMCVMQQYNRALPCACAIATVAIVVTPPCRTRCQTPPTCPNTQRPEPKCPTSPYALPCAVRVPSPRALHHPVGLRYRTNASPNTGNV